MRIGIDGYNVAMPHGTGIATYARNLARCVSALGHETVGVYGIDVGRDPAIREFRLYDHFGRREPLRITRAQRWRNRFGNATRVNLLEVPQTGRIESRALAGRFMPTDHVVSVQDLYNRAYAFFRLTGQFLQVRSPVPIDLMHWTYPIPIHLAGARNIYTVHDLIPLKLPFATLDHKADYFSLVKRCIAGGEPVLTVSESSRRDIVELFGVAPERVVNCYQAVDFAAEADPAQHAALTEVLRTVHGLEPGSYFLYFGALEPKKNVGRILSAFIAANLPATLVIVAGRGWQAEEEERAIAAMAGRTGSDGPRVLRLDYLARDLLTAMIRNARAVTFPSLYEGFGLPILEAMQWGTPVIASTTSSMPEVAGEAALLVDPYDTAALTQAMRRLHDDPALRQDLADRGREQARQFTMERYAERLELLYARSGMLLQPTPGCPKITANTVE